MGESSRVNKVGSLLILNMLIISTLFSTMAMLPDVSSFSDVEEDLGAPLAGQKPISTIVNPANNSLHQQLTSITGTASPMGNNTTIQKVDVSIKRLNDNKYWDGYIWNVTQIWFNASGTSSWSYDTSSVSWIVGLDYQIQSRATDSSFNVEYPKYGNKFTIDPFIPQSTITSPTNYHRTADLDTISGTAYSNVNNTITMVEIKIRRQNDDHFWNGTNWSNLSQPWLMTTGNISWSYNSSSIPWTTAAYTVQSKATDNQSNVENVSASIIFYIDNTKPTSTITQPINNSFLQRLKKISGSAEDGTYPNNGSWVKKIEFIIQRLSDNYYWGGSGWNSTETWLKITGYSNFSAWNFGTSNIIWRNGTQYLIRTRAIDAVDNVENPKYGKIFTCTRDTFYSVISLINNSYFNKLNVIDGVTHFDNQSINIDKVEILIQRNGDSNYWNGSGWNLTKTWLMTTGNATWSYNSSSVQWTTGTRYRVQSRAFNNKSELEILSYGKRFRIDLNAPTSNINSPANNSIENKLGMIYGNVTDTGSSGVNYVEIAIIRMSDNEYWDGFQWNNNITWLDVGYNFNETLWYYNTSQVNWTNNTQYRLRSRATDYASNIETPSFGINFTIIIDLSPHSFFKSPIHNSEYFLLDDLRGGAWAADYSLKISKIEITIKRLSDNKYWDGTSWKSSITWLLASGKTSWIYHYNKPWQVGNYRAQSRAIDNQSNVETPSFGVIFTIKIGVHSSIDIPIDNATYGNVTTISGSAYVDYNNSNISKVEVFISRIGDGKYWNGISWTSTITWLLGNGTNSWFYNTSFVSWTNNSQYLVRSRATDDLSNVQIQSPYVRFFIVFGSSGPSQEPTSSISFPINNSNIDPPNTISGIATISGRTITKVEISILRISDNRVWSGSSWVFNLTYWLVANGTSSWWYNCGSVSWTKGAQYRVRSRATDNLSNLEAPSYGNVFTIKTGSPSPPKLNSNIISPVNNSYLKSLSTISGTASTPSNNTTVTQVEILIFNMNNNLSWNGAGWNLTQTWLLVTGTTSWSYNTGTINWTIGNWYLARSRATDNLSNLETPSYGNRFKIDNKKPTSSISNPKNNTVSAGITIISGSASDLGNSGIVYVDITIQRMDNSNYWNGNTWVGSKVWLRVNGKYSWLYSLGNSSLWTYNKTYRIRSRATDRASNVETPSYGNLYTYRIVAQKPASFVVTPKNNSYINTFNNVNGKAYTNLNYSTLTKVEISIKRLSDNKYWGGSNWITSLTWLLATGKTTWSYNTGSVTWSSGTNYLIRSKAADNRSQVEVPKFGNKFMFDNIRPASNITNPVNNATLSSLNYINGTSWDTSGSGVGSVELYLKRLSDNKYWDGYYWNISLSWYRITGTNSWSYDCSPISWTNNTQYIVRSRSIDKASNVETPSAGNKFTMKWNLPPQKPYSMISYPVENEYLNSLNQIHGKAYDYSGTGLKKVEITIRSNSNSKYWSGTSWVSSIVWLTTKIFNNTWSYSTSTVSWSNGAVYQVQSMAMDNNSIVEIPGTGVKFTFDMQKPSSNIVWPKDNSSLKSLNIINGTASDSGKAGLNYVELFIRRSSDNKYWTGMNWSLSVTWLTAVGRTYWYYNTANANWNIDTQYITRSRAVDNANNIEINYPLHRFSFTINVTQPNTTIDIPKDNSYINNLNSISGRASITNNLSIKKVEISIKRLNDHFYWGGKNWQSTEKWLTATGTTSWTYNSTNVKWSNGVSYNIRGRLTDSWNVSEIPSAGITFMFDNKPPLISNYKIEYGGKYTKFQSVNLTIQATDSESGVFQMAFSSDGLIWTSWQEFEKNTIFNLNRTPKDGKKVIYCKIKDRANNFAITNDSIILDTTPPYNLKLLINNGSAETNSTSVLLYISAKDNGSGAHKVAISTNKLNWSAWINLSLNKQLHMVPFTLSSGYGVKTVYVKVRDVVGFIAGPVSDSIILNTTSSMMMMDFDEDGILNYLDAFPNDPAAATDSDEDGYPDYWNSGKNEFDSTTDLQLDAFPNDPAASIDTDRDNSPDRWNQGKTALDSTTNLHLDAFPNDPAASLDSDGDNYPDSWNPGKSELDSTENLILDAFPNDPAKFEAEQVPNYEVEDAGDSAILIIIGLIVVITIIILLSFFVFRNRNQRKGGGQELNDRILEKLKSDILNDKISDGLEISNEEILNKLIENYEQGNISDQTYYYIRNIINDKNH